jgi:hypothetical protein
VFLECGLQISASDGSKVRRRVLEINESAQREQSFQGFMLIEKLHPEIVQFGHLETILVVTEARHPGIRMMIVEIENTVWHRTLEIDLFLILESNLI